MMKLDDETEKKEDKKFQTKLTLVKHFSELANSGCRFFSATGVVFCMTLNDDNYFSPFPSFIVFCASGPDARKNKNIVMNCLRSLKALFHIPSPR
jgi:hypothetical protein